MNINYGVWNVAVNTAPILKSKYGIESELWYHKAEQVPDLSSYQVKPFQMSYRLLGKIPELAIAKKLDPTNTLIASHGCWMLPSQVAAALKKYGFKWVYAPHGMMEPWSMKHKRAKKLAYFYLREKWLIRSVDVTRAVGFPEYQHLKTKYDPVVLIPNGTEVPDLQVNKKVPKPISLVFIGRLHRKKGILPLVRAFSQSELYKNPEFELLIAGPDEGELPKLQSYLESTGPLHNIKYIGPVYGEEKKRILQSATYFCLPSHSEGFPTSVVEAMSYGLIPLISKGCNFPEAFAQQLAWQMEPEQEQISQVLHKVANISEHEISGLRTKLTGFIADNYSLEKIAEQQAALYRDLLS